MFKYIKIILMSFFVIACSISCAKKIDIDKLSGAYSTVQGQHLDFSSNKNKWIVINYWATWCAPCKSEVKEINKFISRNVDKVYLVGVALEPLKDNLLSKAIDDFGIEYPVVNIDLINDWFKVDTEMFPTTYLINSNGKLVKTFIGAVSANELESAIKSIK